MYKQVKKFIPLTVKHAINSVFKKQDIALPAGGKALIFLAADYGNIGDLAITAAQKAFLTKILASDSIVYIPISKTRVLLQSIKKQVTPQDLITIIGGGNMGSLYPDIEELRQLVIRSFPHNRIVCFPQTLDWDDSKISHAALRKIVSAYSRHPDIHVFARESITRDKLSVLFREHSNVKVGYVPDIVMSASAAVLGATSDKEPAGILRCLRNDRECALDAACYAQLDAALTRTGQPITQTDTHAGGSQLNDTQCAHLLADKLGQFRAARLVVTDRLHGMILSVLAGTPCIVLPNANHKIRQTWLDWLQGHPLVAFIEPAQLNLLPEVLHRLLAVTHGNLHTPPIDGSHYAPLQKALLRT